MSSSEQPATESMEPEAEAEARDRSVVLRDAIIAGTALLLSGMAVGVYFVYFRNRPRAEDETPKVSAAEWLGREDIDHPRPTPTETSVDKTAVKTEETYAPKAEIVDASAPDSLGPSLRHGTVQSGVPVIASLQKLGLSMQQAHEVITALNGIYDFRKARPGHSFELAVNGAGEVAGFSYHSSLTEVYEVKRQGDALKGFKRIIPTQKETQRLGGTVASSLYKTVSDLGAHAALAGMIVDVLSGEVNFYKEQRPGDTFRVVVESESLNGEFLGYGPVLALEYNGVKSGKQRFFRLETADDRAAYYNAKGISQPRSAISIPLHYTRLSSRFGTRYHPILKRKQFHNGVDFAAGTGAPVWACREGEVTLAANKGPNGNLVIIRHEDELQSIYAHLQRFASGIKAGVHVRERQVIGYVGSTGRSTGPHLHFGLKQGSRFIDPLKYKVQPGRPVPAKHRSKLKEVIETMSALLDQTRIAPPTGPIEHAPDQEDEVLGLEDW